MKWLMGLLLLTCLPLQAAEVKRGYPASYELARMAPSGDAAERVMASGNTLLLPGREVTVDARDDRDGGGARMWFRLEMAPPEEDADRGKMVLHSRVELASTQGRKRVQAGDDADSFIEGPQVTTSTFTSESWRRLGDPTPIVVPFRNGGQSYRLTVIMDPVYTEGR